MRTLTLVCCCLVSLFAVDFDLSGPWQVQGLHNNWDTAEQPQASEPWIATTLPAPRWADRAIDTTLQALPGVWLKRTFTVNDAQAAQQAALRWDDIRWGFQAWINGQALPERETYGPGALTLPPGLLHSGDNILLIKVRHWSALPRSASGQELLPVGAGDKGWGHKGGYVMGAIGLDFYHTVRIRAALLDGDPRKEQVQVLVRSDQEAPAGTQISARIVNDQQQEIGRASGAWGQALVVSTPGLPAWHPDSPRLCRAEITVHSATGELFDSYSSNFGARVISINDRLQLDGRPLRMFGSNMVYEWLWLSQDEQGLRQFLVDDARAMHVGGFRTHTLPPPHAVAEICDRSGQWLLAEMPATYNGTPNRDLTEAEEHLWRERAQAMWCAWAEQLHNHPSILAWVPINEPPMNPPHPLHDWFHQTLIPKLEAASPGRPAILATGTTQSVHDIHIYAGHWGGAEQDFFNVAQAHAQRLPPGRLLSNTEYIEGNNTDRTYRWTGSEDVDGLGALRYAAIGAAQTETLRLLNYRLILPYWFGAWQRPDPTKRPPMFAALASALHPLGVAIHEAPRNVLCGSRLPLTITLFNESNSTQELPLALGLVANNPLWNPQGLDGLSQQGRYTLKPWSRQDITVDIPMPQEAGTWTLVASNGQALSQRPLRCYVQPQASTQRLGLIGAPPEAAQQLRALGYTVVEAPVDVANPGIEADVLVVWEQAQISAAERMAADSINGWIQRGGRMLMMAQDIWNEPSPWSAFPKFPNRQPLIFTTEVDRGSTLWSEPGSRLWGSLPTTALDGVNGLGGVTTRRKLKASWIPGSAPIISTPHGWVPDSNQAIVLDAEGQDSNWRIDIPETRFVLDGALRSDLQYLHGTFALLNTHQPPQEAYTLRLPIGRSPFSRARLFVFEHARRVSSPLRWRVGNGPWHHVDPQLRGTNDQRLHPAMRLWFSWSDLGEVDLPPEGSVLEFAIDQPNDNGIYHAAIDAALLVPPSEAVVHARSGSREPAVIEVPIGAGRVFITSLGFAGHLDPESPNFDPALATYFGQLLIGSAP